SPGWRSASPVRASIGDGGRGNGGRDRPPAGPHPRERRPARTASVSAARPDAGGRTNGRGTGGTPAPARTPGGRERANAGTLEPGAPARPRSGLALPGLVLGRPRLIPLGRGLQGAGRGLLGGVRPHPALVRAPLVRLDAHVLEAEPPLITHVVNRARFARN